MIPGALAEARAGVGWRVPRTLDLALTAALGALHSLTFVHTSYWFVQMALVACLAWRVRDATPKAAAGLGLVFATAWLAASTWWLYISMHDYGNLPAWLAVLAVAALSSVLASFLAAAMALFARWRTGSGWRDALVFAALWLLAELARGVVLTGFPWVSSGYAHVDGPLAVLGPWIGVYGMGGVAAWLAAWPVLTRGPVRWVRGVPFIVCAAVLGAAAGFGVHSFTEPTGSLSVALLQGNVPQDEKFTEELMPQQLAWTSEQLLGARADLVLAPETVIPLLPSQLDPDYWEAIVEHFRQPGRAALVGLPLGDEVVGYTNSAAGITAESAELSAGYYRYDKHHLVPFGEFVPTGFHWFTELMRIPLGDFNRGALGVPSFVVKGERVAANICYEDLFGEELAARFAEASTAPTVFANISNIGWFGNTVAIAQHLNISRMRALEFQRPMLRATNTGATVVIDHRAQVTARLAPYTRGVLLGQVQGRSGLTPYAWWASRFGLLPIGLLAGLIVAAAARYAGRPS